MFHLEEAQAEEKEKQVQAKIAEQAQKLQELEDQKEQHRIAYNAKDVLDQLVATGKGQWVNGTIDLYV